VKKYKMLIFKGTHCIFCDELIDIFLLISKMYSKLTFGLAVFELLGFKNCYFIVF